MLKHDRCETKFGVENSLRNWKRTRGSMEWRTEGSKKNPAALKDSVVGLLSRDQALSKDRSPAL